MPVTPSRLLGLNAAMGSGEVIVPYLMSMLFSQQRYGCFGVLIIALQATVLLATAAAWGVQRAEKRTVAPRQAVHS